MATDVLPEKKIDIDFASARRTSFLPDNFSDSFEKHDVSLKAVKVLECHEDDDLFMYVGGDQGDVEEKPLRKFCTGSKYLGQWNKLGIAGKGVYKYPHGVIYDGYFNRNGEFHGTGVLVYPSGQRIEGIWKNGRLGTDTNFVTKAGVVMNKNYCVMPDRRFQIELEHDLNPPGQEFLTDEDPPPRAIPPECYDIVEGFFDPKVKTVYGYPKEHRPAKVSAVDRNTSKLLNKKSSTKYLYDMERDMEDPGALAVQQVSQKTDSEVEFGELMMSEMCEDSKFVSWIPSQVQEEWIIRNCRMTADKNTGFRPDLYEEWTKGGAGLICNVEADTDNDSDTLCEFDILKLQEKKPKAESPRLKTFVQNRHEHQEAVAIDMLTKMILSKGLLSELTLPSRDNQMVQ